MGGIVRYIVRTCEGREAYLAYVQERLPKVEVVRDRVHNALDTFLLAMEAAGGDAVVHLEDDIILTSDFEHKIERLIGAQPQVVQQFFSMRKDDLLVGSRWDRAMGFSGALCFYFPEGYSAALLDYYHGIERPELERWWPTGIDWMVGSFLALRRERYWINVPSLVQHRIGPSAIGSRSSRRQSLTFME